MLDSALSGASTGVAAMCHDEAAPRRAVVAARAGVWAAGQKRPALAISTATASWTADRPAGRGVLGAVAVRRVGDGIGTARTMAILTFNDPLRDLSGDEWLMVL